MIGEHASAEAFLGEEYEVKANMPLVERNVSASEGIPGDCFLHETGKMKLATASNMKDPVSSNHESRSVARTSASFAEHVIESSLVAVQVIHEEFCVSFFLILNQ